MKIKMGETLLAVLLVLNMKAFSQDQEFYIFLCFGQSDMEGNAKFESQDTTVDSRFESWHLDAAAIESWEAGMLKQCFPY